MTDELQAFGEYRAHGGRLDFTAWQEKQEGYWRTLYTPQQLDRLQAMANSKGIELDEQTAAELMEIVERV